MSDLVTRKSSMFGDVNVAYVPLPVASLTRDVATIIDPADRETARIEVTFDQGVTIVAFYVSVRPAEWGSYVASGQDITPDDILVDWDINVRTHLTSAEVNTPGQANSSETRCTLGSLAVEKRLLNVGLPAQGKIAPKLGFKFSWRGPVAPATGAAPAKASIRVTILAEPLPQESA